MKVALAYDEVPDPALASRLPEDCGAEFEDPRTIQALLRAIRSCGYDAVEVPLRDDFPQRIRDIGPDLVFNIAEGLRGATRESIVPAWLDHLGIAYTGSHGLSLALSLDKALTKTLVGTHGVRTPAFRRIISEGDLPEIDLPFPLFVKPNAEGSSMGIRHGSRVENSQTLAEQVRCVLQTYKDCLVETFAPGREFCVGILGNEQPQILPIAEVLTEGSFYSYEEKHAHRKELLCPAAVPQELADTMQHMALTAFETLGCRDLARVDFKLDASGQPAFLEINPLPGLSPYYGIFPRQAGAAGISHDHMIRRIIEIALRRSCYSQERISL